MKQHTLLHAGVVNLAIIPFYLLEQILKIWAFGWRRYFWKKTNLFDALITLCLVIVQIIYLALFGVPYWKGSEVCPRIK